MSRLLVVLANTFFATWNGLLRLCGKATVAEIDVDELRLLLDDPAAHIVLVDVRETAETDVSVIPGALTKEQFEANIDQYRGAQVVAYCTVGGRSFLYARDLQNRGFRAANFKASIIGWCEAGGELTGPTGEPTRRVHTYSAAFSVPADYEAVH